MKINTSRGLVKSLAVDARVRGLEGTDYAGEGDTACSRPREMFLVGHPDKIAVGLGMEADRPVAQTLKVRCRQCPECLRHRARLWTARAMAECKFAIRTWFGTLTLSPERQVWARYSAISRLERRLADIDDNAVFQESVRVIAPEITRFLKRVRKVAPFRYLLVTEAHKSGLPHFHLLLHEYSGRIGNRVWKDKWRFGYGHFVLVADGDTQQCGYVCKYLSKSALTRVRASKEYGQGAEALFTERVVEATRDFIAETKEGFPTPGPVPGY